MLNNKLILKNTVYLYFRQFLVLFVALYTTRLILQVLGVEDYGIYNLIAGVVTMLSVITASMTAATQRFLAMSLGKNGKSTFDSIYDVCYTFFIILSLIVLILGETVGLWFINSFLDIPLGRENAANWCYQMALFTFIVRMIRVPDNAAIIAFEKMEFYAYISILDVLLQLLVVYVLFVVSTDPLSTYSVFIFFTSIVSNLIYSLYAYKKLGVRLHRLSMNRQHVHSIFSFSFWTFFGTLANIVARQGMAVVINRFFGVRLNAASALATKVGGNAYDFVANFTTAYRPQIFKLYASGEKEALCDLIYRTTKLSCYLFILIMIPLNLLLDSLLPLWLGVVPDLASTFCRLLMIFFAVDALQSPLIALVAAIGDIKRYQIIFSTILLMNIPVMYVLMKCGFPATYIYITYIVFNVLSSLYRVMYVRKRSDVNITKYLWCVFRILITSIVAYVLCSAIVSHFGDITGWVCLIQVAIVLVIITLCIIYIIGMDKPEKKFILNVVKEYFNNKKS